MIATEFYTFINTRQDLEINMSITDIILTGPIRCMRMGVGPRRGSRVKVLEGLLRAWKICAKERSNRAGGGCGRGKPPSHGRDFLKIRIVNKYYAFLSMVNTCFKGRI